MLKLIKDSTIKYNLVTSLIDEKKYNDHFLKNILIKFS